MEAAFFDLDKTVIARASMVAFGRSFYREGLISRALLLRALWGQLVYLQVGASEEKLEKIRDSLLVLTRGWDQQRVQRIVAEALDVVVEPIVYAEALAIMDEHRAAGRLIIIVSASPEEVVVPIARHLGCDGVIATRAEVDREGRYTGRVAFHAYGPWKAQAMRGMAAERGIDLPGSWAYSDSASDIPMLDCVGHAVAVNPDRELARVARERGWEVRSFVRPVRLWDRVPRPAAGPTAAGALVTGALVGGFVWWRLRRAEQARAEAEADASAVAKAARRVRSAYSTRSLRAATTPRATRTASSSSFFMPAR